MEAGEEEVNFPRSLASPAGPSCGRLMNSPALVERGGLAPGPIQGGLGLGGGGPGQVGRGAQGQCQRAGGHASGLGDMPLSLGTAPGSCFTPAPTRAANPSGTGACSGAGLDAAAPLPHPREKSLWEGPGPRPGLAGQHGPMPGAGGAGRGEQIAWHRQPRRGGGWHRTAVGRAPVPDCSHRLRPPHAWGWAPRGTQARGARGPWGTPRAPHRHRHPPPLVPLGLGDVPPTSYRPRAWRAHACVLRTRAHTLCLRSVQPCPQLRARLCTHTCTPQKSLHAGSDTHPAPQNRSPFVRGVHVSPT